MKSTIVIDNELCIREENNGITVYDKKTHRFYFYENVSVDDIKKASANLNINEVKDFLDSNNDCLTQNINARSPLYIGWQLSELCNMDCIYCFADDKLHDGNTEDIMDVCKSIMALNPICVGLSGGEPTLNRNLPEIIKMFNGKISYILNTNGTTPTLKNLIPLLKEAGILVRISIDSTDNRIQNYQRPLKAHRDLDYDQLSIIRQSVKMILDADIPLEIHTVATTKDREGLIKTGNDLVEMGVKRWHIYKMDKCPKNKDFFDDLVVEKDEMEEIYNELNDKFGDKMIITAVRSSDPRPKGVLLVDSRGRFHVKDSSKGEIIYVGKDPYNPTIDELHDAMNWDIHQKCYYTNLSKNV